jgi:hypothetical protein
VQYERQIGTIRARVAQRAAVLVLEPIVEADLPPEPSASRAEPSVRDAVRHVHAHDHAAGRIRRDLHVVARAVAAVGELHRSRHGVGG